jgi:hypothetical protein
MLTAETRFMTAEGKALRPRPEAERPLNPACPMHLRRICGTCAEFPPGAPMAARAQLCARWGVPVDGATCAKDCPRWTRKDAHAVSQLNGKE